MRIHIDLETYSSADITTGEFRYVDSGDFEILLLGYAVDDSPVTVIDAAMGEPIPDWLIQAIRNSAYTKVAHNAVFEMTCLNKAFGGIDASQWECTMVHAAYCGLPSSLSNVGKVLKFPEDKQKMKVGKDLIRFFCIPNKDGSRNLPKDYPEKWELFKEYNARDVEVERDIDTALSAHPVPKFVWHQWVTDYKINSRGVYADAEMSKSAIEIGSKIAAEVQTRAKRLYGIDNMNSVKQLKDLLASHGVETKSLGKQQIQDLLMRDDLPDEAREILELRAENGKSSLAKYDAVLKCLCKDGRLRGMLKFYGANRTGRWSGRLVQLQNLPRTYIPLSLLPISRKLVTEKNDSALNLLIGDVPDTLSQLIRTVFKASPGNKYIDCDFSAIEARVIAWLAGEEWTLQAFRNGEDIYCTTASRMFNMPVEKNGRNKHMRAKGKVAVLACGYGGGVGAMRRMDSGHQLDSLTDEEVKGLVTQWRTANPNVVKLWYEVESAAMRSVETGVTTYAGRNKCLVFRREYLNGTPTLTIQLPSGRKLYYYNIGFTTNRFGGNSLAYDGVDQDTKASSHQFVRLETYSGKLVENITQSVARDCLAEAIENLEASGFPIVFHIHDEVVIDVKPYADDETMLENVTRIMSIVPKWAEGLPLTGDGWVGEFFRKD